MVSLKRICCTFNKTLVKCNETEAKLLHVRNILLLWIFDNAFHEDLFIFLFNRLKVPFWGILTQPSALFPILTLGQLTSHEIGVIRIVKSIAEKTCKMEREFARIVKTLVSPHATFYRGNLKFRFQRRGFCITRVDSKAHMSSDSRFSHYSRILITQFRILKTRFPDLTIKSIVSSGTKWK